MKIYVRYVLLGILKPFIVTLLTLIFFFLFLMLVQLSIKTGFPFSYALRLAPYLLPEILSMTIPIAALLAVTTFFSRMGGNNEIIALKSIGIAPLRVLYPIWTLMFFISIFSIWCNDLSTSWTRKQIDRVLLEGVESMLLSQLRTEKSFTVPTGQFELKVSNVTTDDLLLNLEFSGKIAGINGFAESAKVEVQYDIEEPMLNIHMKNADIDTTQGVFYSPKFFDFTIPLSQIYHSNNRIDPPAQNVRSALENLEVERDMFHSKLATNAIFSFLLGHIDSTVQQGWKNRLKSEKYFERQRNRYRLTIPRVCAAGFSCFFFVWVGAPFAIFLRRSDVTVAFFISFLPILGIYYVLFTFGLEGAKKGILPPSGIWLGNLALGIIGCFFLKKIH